MKKRRYVEDKTHKGLGEAQPILIIKHQSTMLSVNSRGAVNALWKQPSCHTNCCLKLPMPSMPITMKQSLFNAKQWSVHIIHLTEGLAVQVKSLDSWTSLL